MTINLKNKAEIVAKYGKDAKDTGSVETQIALLTEKITELEEKNTTLTTENEKHIADKDAIFKILKPENYDVNPKQ